MTGAVIGKYVTKNEILYSELKEKILNGTYRPGERIIVANVAKEFQVSAMPVREAFQRLQQDELIEIVPHVGAHVKRLDLQTFQEIIYIRNELEPLAAKLAALNMAEAQVDRLFALTEEMEQCVQDRDPRRYTQLNLQFHECIYANCGNSTLRDLIQDLRAKTERSKSIFMRFNQRMVTSTADHKRIAQCIRDRDPDAVYTAFRDHKQAGFEIVLKFLEEELRG